MDANRLKLSFDPLTIEHLGVKMYSHLPNAVAELIANSYDAEATRILVDIGDGADGPYVRISDDGHGMSLKDLGEKYLRIGRNRRESGNGTLSENGLRPISGKKGLGKLALFGIAENITLKTTRGGASESHELSMKWTDLMNATGGDYFPIVEAVQSDGTSQGTTIVLSRLKRVSPIDAASLASSLSTLFNYAGSEAVIIVRDSKGTEYPVNRNSRLESVDVESAWVLPDDFMGGLGDYLNDKKIEGRIVSSTKPLRNNMRGITLYSRGRMVNEPEFFGAAESSFAYSYLTGYLDIDFLDSLEPDVIATDRRAVSWSQHPEMEELWMMLRSLVTTVASERRQKRKSAKKKALDRKLPLDAVHWIASINGPERQPLSNMLDLLSSVDVEIGDSEQTQMVENLERLAPPYAELHWRHLHPSIQDAAGEEYKRENYYHAVEEALKRYTAEVRSRSGLEVQSDASLMQQAFGDGGRAKLLVFDKYVTHETYSFSASTRNNIESGQQSLSVGLIRGFRNPLAHEEKVRLRDSGAFSHEDCLDALSILSHLYKRLDESVSGESAQEGEMQANS
ncbi:TIGR02391 family protein [Arthrobacter koreensis]|uniref:TIGR02391 family protein n=1 Tax=Arthrobacter koreensis TaxID=199136 RepID=A0ABY6FUT1_9MICC|nr:TIGR02391 family protein [Arthrobacter koreensis]UYB36787.1 TIGR02391 family protein [Arthrobacter koreensis]